jgi:hypothetical protein
MMLPAPVTEEFLIARTAGSVADPGGVRLVDGVRAVDEAAARAAAEALHDANPARTVCVVVVAAGTERVLRPAWTLFGREFA